VREAEAVPLLLVVLVVLPHLRPLVVVDPDPDAATLVPAEVEAGEADEETEGVAGLDTAGVDEAVEATLLPQRRSDPDPVLAGDDDEEADDGVAAVVGADEVLTAGARLATLELELELDAGFAMADCVVAVVDDGVAAAREVTTDGDEIEIALL
jgi:hypothetical protein